MTTARDNDYTRIIERLARIEGMLGSLATNERLAKVEERLSHIDRQMPKVEANTVSEAKLSAATRAREEDGDNRRSALAIVVSVVAVIIAFFGGEWTGK